MDDPNTDPEHIERQKRIEGLFLIKFRKRVDASHFTDWDIVKTKDISKSGVCFKTLQKFENEEECEMIISHAHLEEPCHCWAVVKRCEPSGHLNETAFQFVSMDGEGEEALHRVIDELL